MIITEDYERMLRRCAPADVARFEKWTSHLPVREELTPYHCGPHSIRSMDAAWLLVNPGQMPFSVFEIGTCLGHSASIWLELGAYDVLSVDISSRPQTVEAVAAMKNKYGKQFDFDHPRAIGSQHVGRFGMAFIDGGHDFDDVDHDIKQCLSLKIPYLVFDDIGDKWGPGVEPAIHKHGLTILAIVGNLAVCIPPQPNWL